MRKSATVSTEDDKTVTTFSVRLWSGQLQRIHSAALRANKSTPEWILDLLMPATAKTLGDTLPDFPPIKRRPERNRGRGIPGVPDDPQARKFANALAGMNPAMAQQVIAAWIQGGSEPPSAPRRVASKPRR